MRTGKRWLAGVAATALGAGMLVGLSAAPAQAAVASIATSQVGLAIVDPSTTKTTEFDIVIVPLDAAGDPVALGTGSSAETISASITSWPTTSAGVWDDSMVHLTDDTTGGTTAQTVTPALQANGTYGITIAGGDDSATNQNWDITTPGAYNVRITVTTTATGATVVKNLPVIVYPSTTSAPLGTPTWTDSTSTSVVNAASAVANTAATTPAYVKMTDPNGLALIAPLTSFSASMAVDDTADENTVDVTGGIDQGTYPGLYTLTPPATGGGQWVAGANAYELSYSTPTATTSSLPLTVSTATVTASSVVLTTTPAVATTSTLTSPVYTVPAGTTSLTFAATTATSTSTSAWRTTTSAAGGQVTSSAGVAAISGGAYSVAVNLNAAAAANGEQLVFSTGGTGVSGATATVNFATPAPQLAADSPLIAKVGDAVTITGSLVDQWERPLTGAAVVSVVRATPSASGVLASGTVDAEGNFSLTVPASAGPTAAATYTYTVSGSYGGVAATPVTVSVQYTATGEVTSLSVVTSPVSVSGEVPAITISSGGTVTRSSTTTVIVNPATANPASIPGSPGAVTVMTFTSVPSTSIALTGSEGVYISTGSSDVPVAATSGSNTLTISSGDSVRVWSTKAGLNTVTATAGGKTAEASFYGYVAATAARNVAISPDKAEVKPNEFVNFTAKVTDVWGNPVPGVSAAAGNITVTLAGGGSIPAAAAIANTNASGETVFSYTSPTATGSAQITVAGNATYGQFGTSITGAPAPVLSAAAVILVENVVDKSITITGSRTTVRGKPGVVVDGTVKGIEDGRTVKPFFRFPGQTSYTEGSARPEIIGGAFEWQRKTGKKFYAYVTSDDGLTKSNNVVIPAK